MSVSGLVTGHLTAKFGCRYVSLVGALVGFLGYGISLFVTNLYLLYVTMGFVAGMSLSGCLTVCVCVCVCVCGYDCPPNSLGVWVSICLIINAFLQYI